MCGIVGYVGKGDVVASLLDALSRLEYRGYDSAGVAVLNSNGVEVRKRVGKIKALAEDLSAKPLRGHIGVGHCLTGDTLVQLADGRVKRIDTLQGETSVLALDPATLTIVPRTAKVWSHPAPKQLIRLRIPFGSIVCTPQHRVLTVDRDGHLTAKAAVDVQQGDVLLHMCGLRTAGAPVAFQSVSTPRYYRLGNQTRRLIRAGVTRLGRGCLAQLAGIHASSIDHLHETDRNAAESILQPLAACLNVPFPLPDSEPVDSRHGSFVRFPETSSPEVMQWLGYLLGDGHVGRRGIRFNDPDLDTLAVYQGLAKDCFRVRGRVVPLPGVAASMLELNSLGLADWMRCNVLERCEQFLDDVGSLPDDQLAAFLRGLFDAEGCVARQAGQVALTMTDIGLVRRMQMWLLRFDIIASAAHADAAPAQRRPSASLKLLISRGDALAAFRQCIGFSSARKRAWLDQILAAKRDGFYRSSWAVPMSQIWISQRLRTAGVPPAMLRPFNGGRRFTDGQAAKLVGILSETPQASSTATEIQRWLDARVRAQEVFSVRRVPSAVSLVYDLEVEGVENFFANGILSHNSRWATHGEPSERNAHPHTDCTGALAIVHNGIIENYSALKDRLLAKGHTFRSQTDTEVIVHLIEELAKQHPIGTAFRLALQELKGSYAVCLLSEKQPDRLYGARNGSPLIIGVGKGEAFFASDVPAILGRTRRVVYLNDLEVVELSQAGPRLTTLDGREVRRRPTLVQWSLAAARKGGFPHYMLKEIHEQPDAVEHTLYNRLDPAKGRVGFDRRTKTFLDRLSPQEKFVIIACGTAYHAGLVGEYMLEEFARIPVDVDLASEFRYRGMMLDRNTTVIAITQSGETADTLAGIRQAKEQGAKVLAICNVMGSSIARAADAVLYTHAGPEIAVASTKAYTSQLTALSLLTLYLAKARARVPAEQWRRLMDDLAKLPALIDQALGTEKEIRAIAGTYASARNFYYLGRRYNYPTALEGALKLKEICPLIHAEGYAAGEMKHGPISLIHKGWPVVFIATDSPVYEKVISNIEEVRARKGECIVIASEGDSHIKRHADSLITVPKTAELLSPIVNAIPLQLFAYYVADANGCDIDQPPNLAKSVTVE